MKNDQLYISLFIRQRRLMTEGVTKNAEQIESLKKELRDLVDKGEVSQETIDNAPYIPWRGRSLI